MKASRNGFGAIEVLIVIALAGLIGVGGMLAYGKQHSTKEPSTKQTPSQHTRTTNNQSDNAAIQTCEKPYTALKNEKIGIAFCYPESWSIQVYDTPSNGRLGSITLTSGDFKPGSAEFAGSNTGSETSILVDTIDSRMDAPIDAILAGTAQGKCGYKNAKAITIASKKAVSYTCNYEGPGTFISFFDYAGNRYSISINEDADGPNFNDNMTDYQRVVESFQLLR